MNTVKQTIGLIFAALFVVPAVAEECNRGTLDEQYCDRNYDLVADLPLDENDWVDPDTIIVQRPDLNRRGRASYSRSGTLAAINLRFPGCPI